MKGTNILVLGFWVASGLHVLGYTLKAFRETAGGSTGEPIGGGSTGRAGASARDLADRGRAVVAGTETIGGSLGAFGAGGLASFGNKKRIRANP